MNLFERLLEHARRALRLRGTIWVLRVLLILGSLRLLLALAQPVALSLVASALDLDCEYGSLDLSLLSGKAELRELRLSDARAGASAEPRLELEHALVDLDLAATLAGTPTIARVEVDGVRLRVGVDERGRVDWLERMSRLAGEPDVERPLSVARDPLDLTLPVRIAALRVTRAELHLRDESVVPPFEASVHADLDVTGLGAATELSLWATSPEFLETLRLEARGSSGLHEAELELSWRAEGLGLTALAGELERVGLRPVARRLDARGALRLGLRPCTSDASACEGGLALDGLRVDVDGQRALGLDELSVALRRASPTELHAASVRAVGLSAAAGRDDTGLLGAAGLAFVGVHDRGAPGAATRATTDSTPLPRLAVDELAVEQAHLRFVDGQFPEAEPLDLLVRRVALRELAWPPAEASSATLEGSLEMPGLLELATLEGELSSGAGSLGLRARAAVEGLTLARARPQLAALGLEPALADGTLRASLFAQADLSGARPRLSVAVETLELVDGMPLAGLERIGAYGVSVDGSTGSLEVDSVQVVAPSALVRREANGTWFALGLRTLESGATSVADAGAPGRDAMPFALPALRLGRVDLSGAELTLVDEATQPTTRLSLDALSLSLGALDTSAVDAEPTRLSASLSAPGLIDEGALSGTLRAQRDPLWIELRAALRAQGIALAPLAPYLAPAGLEPDMAAGSAQADLHLSLATDTAGAPRVDLALERVALRDGERELAGLEALRARGLELIAASLRLESLTLSEPRLALSRDATGAVHALGLRSSPPRPALEAAQPEAARTAPLALELPEIASGPLKLEAARIAWNDDRCDPPLATALRLDGQLEGLVTDGVPRRIGARVVIDGVAEALVAEGTLLLEGRAPQSAGAVELAAELAATGLRAGPLQAYLPAGTECTLERGEVRASIGARVANHADGGLSAFVGVRDAELRDGERVPARLASAVVQVQRFDPLARVLALGAVSAGGLELAVERDAAGVLEGLGMRVGPAPSADDASAPGATRRAPPSFSGPLPTISLEELSLGLERLEWRDASLGAGAEPLVLRASLRTAAPTVLISPEAEALPPIAVVARASLDALCEEVRCDVQLSPWIAEPELALDLAVKGLHGAALSRVAPALAASIDGAELESGELRTGLRARLALTRRGPLGIDWAAGVRGELSVEPTEFRSRPEGEVLLGLDGVRAELTRFDARSGDARFKSIEILKPRLRARREADGIHALGLLLRLPGEAAAASTTEGTGSDSTAGLAGPSVPGSALASAPDLSIDRLAVTGLDVELVDLSTPVPALVPLTDLELELRKLSTRALAAGGAVQFHARLEAGTVELPPRIESDSIVAGVAGAAAAALSGQRDEAGRLEPRPLFAGVTLAGRLAPFPAPTGWATLDASELELSNFRGIAQGLGLSIGDGQLDLSARVRFAGAEGLSLDSTASFAHLSLSEPADGPISRYLALPAPLDTVLFLLEDAEGRHRLPVSITLGPEGLGSGELVRAAASAAAVVIARAVASSPLRVVGTLTDAFGLTGGEEPPPSASARAFAFEPGDVSAPADADALEALRRKLSSDSSLALTLQHEFGAADLERAERLANPGAGDLRLLSARLRQRKAELSRARAELASRTRLDFALGRSDEAELVRERVRSLERELGLVEGALDRLHELMRPGAERRGPERARAAALAIAAERLERVRQALIGRGIDPTRIEVRTIRRVQATSAAGGRVTATPRKKS